MSQEIFLSIVIPAFNEAGRIGPTLEQVIRFLEAQPFTSEVIVVDDGSSDETARMARLYLEQHTSRRVYSRLLRNPGNRGKGYSVRRGVLSAEGRIVLFTDADLSAPITEAPKLYEPIRRGQADVVFGSRALDPSFVKRPQSLGRRAAGRIFNWLVQALTGLAFKDTQCGFKAYARDAITPVFRLQRIDRFGFDVEILYIARKRGLSLEEVPVVWYHSEGTKVKMLRDSLRMLLDLLQIRWNDFLGRYDGP